MKKLTITSVIAIMSVSGLSVADDLNSSDTILIPTATVSQSDIVNLEKCLMPEDGQAVSRSIRACTKALNVAVPSNEVRSNLYARRGLHYLSNSDYKKAARDFKTSAKLNGDNNYAVLGKGYVALMEEDYVSAKEYFLDCGAEGRAVPLAKYGLGIAKEMSGDLNGAANAYREAVDLRPDWEMPQEELARLNTAL